MINNNSGFIKKNKFKQWKEKKFKIILLKKE